MTLKKVKPNDKLSTEIIQKGKGKGKKKDTLLAYKCQNC